VFEFVVASSVYENLEIDLKGSINIHGIDGIISKSAKLKSLQKKIPYVRLIINYYYVWLFLNMLPACLFSI